MIVGVRAFNAQASDQPPLAECDGIHQVTAVNLLDCAPTCRIRRNAIGTRLVCEAVLQVAFQKALNFAVIRKRAVSVRMIVVIRVRLAAEKLAHPENGVR